MTLLLYSAVSTSYQNWLTFGIYYLEELRFLLILVGLEIPAWQFQLIAIQDLNMELAAILDSTLERLVLFSPNLKLHEFEYGYYNLNV